MIVASFIAAALAFGPPTAPSAEQLGRRYWLAVDAGRRAANMTCSLEDFPRYEDESSPFRRNDKRLRAIADAISELDDDALLLGRRGLVLTPANMWCDDPQAAREALEKYDQRVDELETLVATRAVKD